MTVTCFTTIYLRAWTGHVRPVTALGQSTPPTTAGTHPKIASERLGHSKVGVTLDLYSHVLPGMQEDAVAKVDAAFRKARNGE